MYRSCSRCGRVHSTKYKCNSGKIYSGGDERKLRSTYEWTKKAAEIKEHANYLCEICRLDGIYVYDNLETHHIIKVTEDKTRLLDNYNLVCLCSRCHKKADAGEIDRDLLFEIARGREDKISPVG